ncbi:MAG: methyltransferase domain-containing protein [Candidatus Binatia bacterium]
MTGTHYIIRGGLPGRERLRVLARTMRATTLELLALTGVRSGMACLDVGCGGGDVSLELLRLVAPDGSVVGIDADATTVELARREAGAQGLQGIEFRVRDITTADAQPEFDFAYARFLLSHVQRPDAAVAMIRRYLRRAGVLAVEDVDFTGHFCEPELPAFRRYVELYTRTAQRRGADPNLGPRLPGLLRAAGFSQVEMRVVQPAGFDGEVKLMAPLTMDNIGPAVIAAGFATAAEIDRLVAELYAAARDGRTVMSIPRIVQAWGRRED